MRLESDRERPFYVLEAGELRLDMSFVRTREFQQRASARYEAYRSASDRLRVVQLVQATRQSLQHWGGGAAQADSGRARKPIPGVEPGADVQVFAPPRDAAWLEAWTITEKLIARMNAFSSSNGARFAVALLTHSAQVDPDPSVRKHLADALGVDDLFYVEQRLRAFGERERIPVIALASELQKRADAEQVHFHGFANYRIGWGHWNEKGHRAAAEIIAPRLCSAAAAG